MHSDIWSSGSDWCVSLSILLRTQCILTSGAPRRRLARFLAFTFLEVPGSDWCFLKHSIEKAMHFGIWSSGSDWCVSLSVLLRSQCILVPGAPRLRLVRYLTHSMKQAMHSYIWSSRARIGPLPCIWSSGAPKLRLVHFLKHSIEKLIHFDIWSSQAQISPFPCIWSSSSPKFRSTCFLKICIISIRKGSNCFKGS